MLRYQRTVKNYSQTLSILGVDNIPRRVFYVAKPRDVEMLYNRSEANLHDGGTF